MHRFLLPLVTIFFLACSGGETHFPSDPCDPIEGTSEGVAYVAFPSACSLSGNTPTCPPVFQHARSANGALVCVEESGSDQALAAGCFAVARSCGSGASAQGSGGVEPSPPLPAGGYQEQGSDRTLCVRRDGSVLFAESGDTPLRELACEVESGEFYCMLEERVRVAGVRRGQSLSLELLLPDPTQCSDACLSLWEVSDAVSCE